MGDKKIKWLLLQVSWIKHDGGMKQTVGTGISRKYIDQKKIRMVELMRLGLVTC